MPSTSLPLRHRLAGRLLLFGLVPTVIAVIAGLAVNGYRTYRAAILRIESELGQATRLVASDFETEAVRVSAFVRGLALTHGVGGLATRPAESGAVLTAAREVIPGVEQLLVLREGEAIADPGVAAMYDAAKRRWERIDASRAAITFGEIAGRPVVAHFARIVVQGRPIGAVVAIRAAAGISRDLERASAGIDAQLFLLTEGAASERRLVATNMGDAMKGRAISATEFAEIATEAAASGGGVRVTHDVDSTGRELLVATVGLEDVDWTLVARTPVAAAFAEAWRLVLLHMLTGVAGLVVVAVLLYLLARGVSRRLSLVVASADRIAEGDLAEPVPDLAGRDEVKLLLDSFRAMCDSLNRIVGQVRSASIRINSTATELAATSRQQEETVAGFSASTTQVAAATREISTTGEELLRTMQEIAESASGAARKAEESRGGLESMQEAMRRLDEAANSVAARLATISEKAQGINSIVGTITKVADQTNLLSVNAAIEAEKAGEFGVGFLVVAREIRRLADQTAAATLDIERMVRQMQGAVASGVMEMDRFGETLRAGAVEVSRVGERLEGIIGHVEGDVARVAQVTGGMQNQTAGVRQIDDAMRQLAAGAKQTAQAAKDFGGAAADLQESIAGLKSVVAQVKLRD